MRPTRFRLTALLVAAILNISLAACSTLDSAGSVTVLGPWAINTDSDDEKKTKETEGENFKKVLDAFERKTGIHVIYQGTRAVSEDLRSDVQQQTQRDIVILGDELEQYQREGFLHALDDVIGPQRNAYTEPWLERQRLGTDKLYGVVVKADLKSIIWFNPNHLPNPKPGTWDEFIALSQSVAGPAGTPWCLGMGSPPTSGWPGTDWIEDILLHQFGVETYRQWASGTLPWTSPEVRQAWMDWGTLMVGGSSSALLNDFGDAGRPLFANPPECFLHHQASFIMGNYHEYQEKPTLIPGTDFDFFPFPEFSSQSGDSGGKVYVVAAAMAAMFNDTPQARELIQYLATEEAQEIWPRVLGSGAFSVNKKVKYRDTVSQRIADTLTSDDTLCYDASDLMPATMRNAFNRAVLEYLSDPNQFDSILAHLERIRQGVADEEWPKFLPC